ncbi:MAG: phage upper tail fiber protein, partial [Candidatus Limnocylindrus sp.]
ATIFNDDDSTAALKFGSTSGAILVSSPAGVTGADAVGNIMTLTQAEYDAIVSPVADTLYVIV